MFALASVSFMMITLFPSSLLLATRSLDHRCLILLAFLLTDIQILLVFRNRSGRRRHRFATKFDCSRTSVPVCLRKNLSQSCVTMSSVYACKPQKTVKKKPNTYGHVFLLEAPVSLWPLLAVIACGIGHFHMARASKRLTVYFPYSQRGKMLTPVHQETQDTPSLWRQFVIVFVMKAPNADRMVVWITNRDLTQTMATNTHTVLEIVSNLHQSPQHNDAS